VEEQQGTAIQFERFVTSSVSPKQRLDYWNKITNDTFKGICVDSKSNTFDGHHLRWKVGDLLFARSHASSSIVERDPRSGKNLNKITLHLQHIGSSSQFQGGRSCQLKPGDFTLASCGEYFKNSFPSEHEVLAVEIPMELVEEYVPSFNMALTRTISGNNPSSRMLHDFLLSLWRQGPQGPQASQDPVWCDGVRDIYLNLLGLAINCREKLPQVDSGIISKLKSLVVARLNDPSLGTASLAEELNVSLRTIQLAFSSFGTTPSAYILQQRMNRAAEYLISSHHLSVTDIAMELGFNESSYFTRCFRKHFSMTPSAYRIRH
jgi:AraC-like DNA-binding protein